MVRLKSVFRGFLIAGASIALATLGSYAQDTGRGLVGRQVSVPGGSYRDIDPAELARMLQKKDFTLVNVHVPYEGEIAGTDAFVPFDQVAARPGAFPKARAARIVVYCRSGRMSEIAAGALVKLGYTNIINLAGGMFAWEEAGFKLERLND